MKRFNLSSALLVAAYSLAATSSFASGGNGMQISTRSGMYVIDQPGLTGDTSMAGWVLVTNKNGVPLDTAVSINGVALIRDTSMTNGYWFKVNPNGAQPAVGADGFLHVVASSASTKASRALDLPCPAVIDVVNNPTAGSSLAGLGSVDMSWGNALPQNPSQVLGFMDSDSANLSSYDSSATPPAITGGIAFQTISQTQTGTSLALGAGTNSTGYLLKFRYNGVYLLDGNSGGVCGRELRYQFAQ